MNNPANNIVAERERQLVEALQEFLAPLPLYLNLIAEFAALGDMGGVRYATSNLFSCVRAAAVTYRELLELCDSKREAA